MDQLNLFRGISSEYGGSLRTARAGRAHARPLATRTSTFLTLKSTQAVGPWAFTNPANRPKVNRLIHQFAAKHAIEVLSVGNAGNHLHLHLKIAHRTRYPAFIRGLSSALASAITGHSRWNKVLNKPFFDQRPHTRIVANGRRAFSAVENYNHINNLEGRGVPRRRAECLVQEGWRGINKIY